MIHPSARLNSELSNVLINCKPRREKEKENRGNAVYGSFVADVKMSPVRFVEIYFQQSPRITFGTRNFVTMIPIVRIAAAYFQAILSMSGRNEASRSMWNEVLERQSGYQLLLCSIRWIELSRWTLLPFVLVWQKEKKKKKKRRETSGRYINPWKEVQEYR